MSKLKTIGIVIAITAGLIIVLNLFVGWFVDRTLEKRRYYANSTRGEFRYRLANYEKFPWAKKHFEEFYSLDSMYSSYVGWRRTPFAGETITIDKEGFRVNPASNVGLSDKDEVWFFGGSTMWGTGASDQYTIPAYYENLQSTYVTRNYGESAWKSRQELALLINRLFLEKKKPKVVVFYDGVNDFYNGVLQRAVNMTHNYEKIIREQLDANKSDAHFQSWLKLTCDGFKTVFVSGYMKLIDVAKRKLWVDSTSEGMKRMFSDGLDILSDTIKSEGEITGKGAVSSLEKTFRPCELTESQKEIIAKCVSEQLYTYEIAADICKMYGIKFVVLLQPNALIGSPYRDHIVLELASSPKCASSLYKYYYDQILKKASSLDYFYDLTHLFDSDDPIYIDFCHVSPNGNELVAKELIKILAQ